MTDGTRTEIDEQELYATMLHCWFHFRPAHAQADIWKGGTPLWGLDVAYFSAQRTFRWLVRYQPDGSKVAIDSHGRIRTLERGEHMQRATGDYCCLAPSAPDRIHLVRDLFTWYTRDGFGVRQIVDRLNRQQVPTPRSGTWSARHTNTQWTIDTVRGILRNPAYMAPPEPIVPPDIFAMAQQLREERADVPSGRVGAIRGRGANSPYLLSGLLTCAHCGKAWRGRPPKAGAKNPTVYYACATYTTEGHAACPKWLVPQQEIEAQVLARVQMALAAAPADEQEEEVLIHLSEAELTDAGVNLSLQGLIDAATNGMLFSLLLAWPLAAQRSFVRAFVERITMDPVAQHVEMKMCDIR